MPELLSPAGNFEKMRSALLYGADAVYLAGNMFGMRAAADNFSLEELSEAVKYVHERNKKIYLTVNTMPHEHEYPALREYLTALRDIEIDAMIVADLGVFMLIREILPHMEIHVSTQASAVSAAACRAYHDLGAKRVVLARELTLDEIKAIRAGIPDSLELEAFVHGSMCVSYSGRCMLSNALTGRDANRGQCTQPCRWNYIITEEKRPDTPFPIEQDENGETFIMSSKDMCTVEHIPALMTSGINSFKIEGRMKSEYYTALVTNAYRMAMDAYTASPENYVFDKRILRELDGVSHREYCTGFYFDDPKTEANLSTVQGYLREKAYLARATSGRDEQGYTTFVQRNKLVAGEIVELVSPGEVGREFKVEQILDENGCEIESAPHPMMTFKIKVPYPTHEGDILRSKGD